MSCHLTTQFTTDRATAAGNQNGLAADILEDFIHIDTNRLSAQQVFHGNLPHITHGNLTGYQLADTG